MSSHEMPVCLVIKTQKESKHPSVDSQPLLSWQQATNSIDLAYRTNFRLMKCRKEMRNNGGGCPDQRSKTPACSLITRTAVSQDSWALASEILIYCIRSQAQECDNSHFLIQVFWKEFIVQSYLEVVFLTPEITSICAS